MAEEQELVEAEDVALEEEVSQETVPGADADGEDRQPESQQEIDLDSLPAFRKWKSQMDKRFAQMEKGMSAAERRAYEAEQRLHASRMEGMSEVEKAKYQVQYLNQQLQEMQRLRELDAYAFQKEQDIRRVAMRKGLNYEDLAEALPADANAMVLWEVAEDLAAKQGTSPTRAQPAEQRPRKAAQVNNQVDTGSSRAQRQTDTDRYKAEYDKAKAQFDVSKMIEIKEEAIRRGIFFDA